MFISFVVKGIELILMIMSFSYIFSVFWIILCEAYFDFVLDGTYASILDAKGQRWREGSNPPFLAVYGLDLES